MSNILDKFRLDGKVAVVTGASRGLGQAMALALAEAGASAMSVARAERAETDERIRQLGRQCATLKLDLGVPGAAGTVVNCTVEALGRLDILVNNAGIIRRAPFLDFTESDWDDVIHLNLKAVFQLSQSAARQMVKQGGGGRIINIASMLSFQGGIRVPSYTASKSVLKPVLEQEFG
jgi:2-deoxy-D-gluconate 3-dehydrogenase